MIVRGCTVASLEQCMYNVAGLWVPLTDLRSYKSQISVEAGFWDCPVSRCQFFTKVYRNFVQELLPLLWRSVKTDQQIQMLGEKAEMTKIACQYPSLSLLSFVSLGNQAKRHVRISALVFLHCKCGALLQEDLIVFIIFSVVWRALGNFSSA